MTSITDKNIIEGFANAMEETHNKQLKAYTEITEATAQRSQSHRHLVRSALDTCLEKCESDKRLFDSVEEFQKDLQHKNASLKEKRHAIAEVTSDVEQKEIQKDTIIERIEKLKAEQAQQKELIESQHKANKNRLKNLQKARYVFQDHLGMEIRTICGTEPQVSGKRFQFVFRNINPSDLNSAYIITMRITEDGAYQTVSSDPVLENLPALERRLQETNSLPVFLANIRKEFISQVR
uniref:kinetochore protein Spc25 n=1 Tax=Doryrhamphus excisus TaxID=161450 RepID=UPI0025AEC6A7|nr:kinetochore protein Spc25 [Doryrhamphus excisus]